MAINNSATLAQVRNGSFEYGLEEPVRVSAGVRVVQEALHMYGYNLGSTGADGKYGKQMSANVSGFQKENGLTINGIVNKATLAKLEAWSGTLSETPMSITPTLKMVQYGLAFLHVGNIGSAVSTVRGYLNKHGYSCSTIESYDSNLASLVMKFQTANGLKATGDVDQVTLAVLEDFTADTAWLSGSTVKLTAGKLAKAGFKGILIKPELVTDINKALNKYGITTGEKVLQFLAQAMAETTTSENIMENEYMPGIMGTQSYAPFYGAGLFQMTWEKQYKDFSDHINTPQNGYAKDNQIYISGGKEKNLYATQHVALKYPGVSGGWIWDRAKEINNLDWTNAAENFASLSEQITRKVHNLNASSVEINRRLNYYKQMKAALPYK